MAIQYRTVLYGGAKGIDVSKANVASVASEAGKYLKENGMQPQGIKLPGLNDAMKLVSRALRELETGKKNALSKSMKGGPEMKVLAGIDSKGNLSATVTGLLPPSKQGGKPIKFDETAIIRKDWAKLEAELKSDKNAVVNLTQDQSAYNKTLDALVKKHKGDMEKVYEDRVYKELTSKLRGDKIINRAANRQAAKFKTDAKRKDNADFGGINKGSVILAAHGSRVQAAGVILGAKLGAMSAQQIVTFLTEQKDPKKNLSTAFTGTVLLSGCFTAAGSTAATNLTLTGKVSNLLKAKGIKCKVQGMPGVARTNADGTKSSVKPTEMAAYDRLSKQLKALQAELKKTNAKLQESDGKAKAAAQKKFDTLGAQLKKLKAERELKIMHELSRSYGLDPVR
ncbi:MAG: hypothetical protein AAGC92_07305 [Pseudomonadota bacterium]